MAMWQPETRGLAQISELLLGGTSNDNNVQRRVQKEIDQLSTTVPEYPCYLAYILANGSAESIQEQQLRSLAAYALKTHVQAHWAKVEPRYAAYIKEAVLHTLSDPSLAVNNAASTLLSAMIKRITVEHWPEALQQLIAIISDQSKPPQLTLTIMGAIQKICEDGAEDLIHSAAHPLEGLLPPLIHHIRASNPSISEKAILAISELVHGDTPIINQFYEQMLQSVLSRAMDTHQGLRKAVCYCIVKILEYRSEMLAPLLDQVIQYMIHCTQEKDTAIALEACEFWLVIAEYPSYVEVLGGYLKQLVPTLLSRMVYSEDELIELGGDMDDSHVPDAQQDLKPRHYRSKSHGTERSQDENSHAVASDASDDEGDDDDDGDEINAWTLRKCSAAALDSIANIFHLAILDTMLPLLQETLASNEWLVRESGILALGAIAEGCIEGIQPHLPQLVPFLLQSLNDRPLVRSIACWTLSRYASWIVYEHNSQFFDPSLKGLLVNCGHGSKKVQEAACSALATFEEIAAVHLVPYLDMILPVIMTCFSRYQQKNLLVLYDCIGTLAEAVGSQLAKPEFVNIIIPPLMQKWQCLADNDADLLPLFECLASVVIAVGVAFSSTSKQLFERCIRIIQSTHAHSLEYQNGNIKDEPEKDFYIVSLDLMGAIIQGLGPSGESIVAAYQTQVFQCLSITLSDTQPSVKQSSLGLFGDLVVNTYIHVKPYAHELLASAIEYIQMYDEMSWLRLANNAVWVCGELTSKMGPEMAKAVPTLVSRIMPILCGQYPREAPHTLIENCALTLGRLGNVDPDLLSTDLERFAPFWCKAAARVRDSAEKEASYCGFLNIVQRNPNALLRVFPAFCESIIYCQHVAPTTEEAFRNIVHAYKSLLGPQWHAYLQQLQPATKDALVHRFAV